MVADVDVLVVGPTPVAPGAVVRCRPIGALLMEDEAGGDEKLLAVPEVKTSPYYQGVSEGDHLPPIVLDQIGHFFTHYKDLEPKKWVRIGSWGSAEEARSIIVEAIEAAALAKLKGQEPSKHL